MIASNDTLSHSVNSTSLIGYAIGCKAEVVITDVLKSVEFWS